MRIVGLLGVLAASATILVLAQAASAGILVSDRPDIRIHTGSYAANGVEPYIAVHPDDWSIIAVSIAADSGCAGWTSDDGGASWYGDNAAAHSVGFGDGVVAIQRTGATTRYFILSLSSAESDSSRPFDEGQRVVWKTALQSNTWGNQAFPSPPDSATDKGWLYAENSTGLDWSGYLYAAWFMPTNEGLRFARSTDNGVHWTNPAYQLKNSGYCWGAAIATAIDSTNKGHVYVVWPQAANNNAGPTYLLFRASDDGGQTFDPERTSLPIAGGYKLHSALGNHSQANASSAASIATDDQGNIYVAWCAKRNGANDAQVYVAKSTNEGVSWSDSVALTSSGAHQWQPAIAWDNLAKALVAVYFDDRANVDSTAVYAAVSYDHGSTFQELRIADWQGSGDRFVGDYIGVASSGGVAYPVWCDDRNGQSQAFVSPILVGGIESTSITPVVGHSCAGTGNPRVRFEVDWSTLVAMDGTDKLTVTPPGGSPQVASAASTGTSHTLVVYDLPCVNGTWKYVIESNKGTATSSRSDSLTSVTCISCPPPCNPPCELD